MDVHVNPFLRGSDKDDTVVELALNGVGRGVIKNPLNTARLHFLETIADIKKKNKIKINYIYFIRYNNTRKNKIKFDYYLGS